MNLRARLGQDDGYIAAMTPILVSILLMFVMMLYNGGQQMNAVRQLDNAAQSAARAAAAQIDRDLLYTNVVRIDRTAATTAATNYLTPFGVNDVTIQFNAMNTQVTVTARTQFRPPWFFSSIGGGGGFGGTRTLSATSVATISCGVSSGEDTDCLVPAN